MWDKSTEFEMLSEKAKKKKKKAQILTYAWSIYRERANKWPLAGILAQKHSLL